LALWTPLRIKRFVTAKRGGGTLGTLSKNHRNDKETAILTNVLVQHSLLVMDNLSFYFPFKIFLVQIFYSVPETSLS
jgi:hypothetical protein